MVVATDARAARGRRRTLSIGAGILLAAVLLYFAVRGIAWRDVWHLIRRASPVLLAASAALSTAALFLRAVRWRVLLEAEGHVTVPAAFWATAAGYFGNNFLPMRAGELVRTVMIVSRSALSMPFVLTTALSERVADALALLVVSAGVLLLLPSPPGWMAGAAKPLALAGFAGALVIAVLPLLEDALRAILVRLPIRQGLVARLTAWIEQGLRGMRAFHDPVRLAGFFALTMLIWGVDALGAMITAAALGLKLSLPPALLLLAGLGVGSALPSTPGYVGIYQFVAVSVLTPFGFSRSDAIAFILAAQAVSYGVCALWGVVGLVRHRRERPPMQPRNGQH